MGYNWHHSFCKQYLQSKLHLILNPFLLGWLHSGTPCVIPKHFPCSSPHLKSSPSINPYIYFFPHHNLPVLFSNSTIYSIHKTLSPCALLPVLNLASLWAHLGILSLVYLGFGKSSLVVSVSSVAVIYMFSHFPVSLEVPSLLLIFQVEKSCLSKLDNSFTASCNRSFIFLQGTGDGNTLFNMPQVATGHGGHPTRHTQGTKAFSSSNVLMDTAI